MGVKTDDSNAFMEMERKYYRLAHAHRMTLNVLPYSGAGEIDWASRRNNLSRSARWNRLSSLFPHSLGRLCHQNDCPSYADSR